jgi:peptide/nickel transport system permease protein
MKTLQNISFAAAFAGLLTVIAIFADFFSSNPPATQNLEQFFHPPSRVHWRGGPVIYPTLLSDPLDVRYQEKTETGYRLQFFFKGYRYRLFGLIPMERHLIGRSEPPYYYPMGTDELGRDVLARVFAGTRTSMLVVVLGLALYAALGITIGALAGLCGGWVDSLLMRLSEFVLALPALYLVLALRAALPVRIPFIQTLFLMVGTIAAVAWPPMARGIRGLILQLRSSGHVEAARCSGGTPAHIFRRHMLPFLRPFAVSQLTVAAPIFLLGEVILSFLDIGFHDSGESWGSMLRSLKDTRILTDFWWNLLPLGMVFLTLLCMNLFGSRTGGEKREGQLLRM